LVHCACSAFVATCSLPPHCGQDRVIKLLVGAGGVFGIPAGKGFPQAKQNFAPIGLALPQFGQVMDDSGMFFPPMAVL
jgi:hypothetical protein